MTTPFAIVESPFAGDIKRNSVYLHRCIHDAIASNYIPFASHGLYPAFLDDDNPDMRTQGITFGYEIGHKLLTDPASRIIFYIDYGMSNGMLEALSYWTDKGFGKYCEFRKLGVQTMPKGSGAAEINALSSKDPEVQKSKLQHAMAQTDRVITREEKALIEGVEKALEENRFI